MPLGDLGANHVKACLARGNTLARLLRSTLVLNRGDTFAFLPTTIDASELADLEHGLQMSSIESANAVSEAFAALADHHRSSVCVFEDSEARPGDQWLASARSSTRRRESEVYHVARVLTADGIRDAMRDAQSSWLLIGVLSAQFPGWEHPTNQQLTDRDIRKLVTCAVAVVVSAFDGEGYVIWVARGSASAG